MDSNHGMNGGAILHPTSQMPRCRDARCLISRMQMFQIFGVQILQRCRCPRYSRRRYSRYSRRRCRVTVNARHAPGNWPSHARPRISNPPHQQSQQSRQSPSPPPPPSCPQWLPITPSNAALTPPPPAPATSANAQSSRAPAPSPSGTPTRDSKTAS